MKRVFLITTVFLLSLTTSAQNLTYKYSFYNNLTEQLLRAPALTAICPGTYASEALPAGITKPVYRFSTGCGLVYSDVSKNFLASGSYTIELYFKLDTITGYKKLVDFDSLKKDAGLYSSGGRIALYPSFTSVDSFTAAGVYQYVAITRDGTSKKMYINANGKTAGTYTDNTDQFKLGVDKLLTFFRDDKVTSGEHSKGSVATIQISNYAIDSNIIKTHTGIGTALSVPGNTAQTNRVVIYPNPAGASLFVTTVAACNYTISDITGKPVRTGIMLQGENNISMDDLSSGLYVLKMQSNDGTPYALYKFTKL